MTGDDKDAEHFKLPNADANLLAFSVSEIERRVKALQGLM
jgi:hypothetical protein